MNYYQIVIKQGKYKNRIIEEGLAASRNKMIEKNKQSLIDAGVYAEAAGVIWKRNFTVKLVARS